MIDQKRVLGLITARGGSKGLPGKNLKELLGKPLLVWTVEQGLESTLLDRLILSTDDSAIAEVGRQAGVEVPFIRPPELARDDSPSIDSILHALDMLEKEGEYYEYLVLLEPTSPLRKKDDIDRAIMALDSRADEADSLIALGKVSGSHHPSILYELEDGIMNRMEGEGPPAFQRQLLNSSFYFPNGLLYITKTSTLRTEKTRYAVRTLGFLCERWQNQEIDDMIDFLCVEAILKQVLKGGYPS